MPSFPPAVVDALVDAQTSDGAFRSFVTVRGRVVEDRNGFITALVVRAIGHDPLPPCLTAARERGLDYLERCARQCPSGSFGFWPLDGRPTWAPDLPADADDTAVIALELFRGGRRSLDWLRRVALCALLPFTVRSCEGDPAWVTPGVFRTWLARGGANPVDCTVNVNVAALLAVAGLTHIAACRAAVSMVGAAVGTAGDLKAVARLSPFYAHPLELRWALAHAVASGAHDFQTSLDRLDAAGLEAIDVVGDRPVCCAAYGVRCWSAPILQLARHARAGAAG